MVYLVDWSDIGDHKKTTYWEYFCDSCGEYLSGLSKDATGEVLDKYSGRFTGCNYMSMSARFFDDGYGKRLSKDRY